MVGFSWWWIPSYKAKRDQLDLRKNLGLLSCRSIKNGVILAEISSQAPTHWTRCTATFLPSRSIISLVILRSSGKPFHMQVDTGFGGRTVPSSRMAYTNISLRTPLLESYKTLVPSFGCAIVVRGDILRRCVFSQVLETCLGEHKANYALQTQSNPSDLFCDMVRRAANTSKAHPPGVSAERLLVSLTRWALSRSL